MAKGTGNGVDIVGLGLNVYNRNVCPDLGTSQNDPKNPRIRVSIPWFLLSFLLPLLWPALEENTTTQSISAFRICKR